MSHPNKVRGDEGTYVMGRRDELLAEAERDPQAARQQLQAERDAGRMSDRDADQVARVIFREMWRSS